MVFRYILLLITLKMAVTAEIVGDLYSTKINDKLESLPYYDEVEKKIKYHYAQLNVISGYKAWFKNGELHSFDDEPAIIHRNGDKYWYKNEVLHRDGDLPAYIGINGVKQYYKNGKLHRDNDLPAVIDIDRDKWYYKNGVRYTPKSEQKEDDYLFVIKKKITDDVSLSVVQKQNAAVALELLGVVLNK